MLDKIKETTDYIFAKTGAKPDYGIVLGSGLGGLVNEIQIEHALEYTSIPNFPVSTVKGHGGKLIFGKLGGKKCDRFARQISFLRRIYDERSNISDPSNDCFRGEITFT